jgi:hypothetical protein
VPLKFEFILKRHRRRHGFMNAKRKDSTMIAIRVPVFKSKQGPAAIYSIGPEALITFAFSPMVSTSRSPVFPKCVCCPCLENYVECKRIFKK